MSFNSFGSSSPDGRRADVDRDEQRRRAAEVVGEYDEINSGELTTGRRRRARGEKGFERELDSDVLVDRQEIISVPVAPTRRLVSLAVAAFGGLLGLALVLGAHTVPRSFALVIFGVQVLFVVSWTVATRPPSGRVVAAVGLITAVIADLAVALPATRTFAPIGYATVAGFVLGMVGQLIRRDGRSKVTESVGATLSMVLGVVAYATLIVLRREPLGTEAVVVCLGAGTVAVVVARAMDVILPFPRTTPQVARGTIGIIVGAMAGTVAAGLLAANLQGVSPGRGVLAGMVTALVAVLADLGVGYAEASREIDGEVNQLWVVRHMQGPLGAFALCAPVAYAMSVMVLIPALS